MKNILKRLFRPNVRRSLPLPGRAYIVTAWPQHYYDWMQEQREARLKGEPWYDPNTAVWVANTDDLRGRTINAEDAVLWRGPTPKDAKAIMAALYVASQFGGKVVPQ